MHLYPLCVAHLMLVRVFNYVQCLCCLKMHLCIAQPGGLMHFVRRHRRRFCDIQQMIVCVCVNRHTMLIAAQKFCTCAQCDRLAETGYAFSRAKVVLQSYIQRLISIRNSEAAACKQKFYIYAFDVHFRLALMRGMKRAGCALAELGPFWALRVRPAAHFFYVIFFFFYIILCILLVNYIIFNCVCLALPYLSVYIQLVQFVDMRECFANRSGSLKKQVFSALYMYGLYE